MDISDYQEVLVSFGFLNTKEYKYARELSLADSLEIVYLTKTRTNSSLVIHPCNESRVTSFKALRGVTFRQQSEVYIHNTAFVKFPMRMTKNSKNPIHYGLEFESADHLSARQFIESLLRASNPDTDIEAAQEDLSGLEETERDATIKSRKGQGPWRTKLDKLWSKCSVTGCCIRPLLRGSHIKPWRVCNNMERLDMYNGLLLRADLDALFDSGLITFDENGKLIFARELSLEDRSTIPLVGNERIAVLTPEHVKYLSYHMENVFRGA